MENSSSISAKLEKGLSALIINFNEESNIKSVIENLTFADEIIIVDSYSTDATVSIASSFENVKSSKKNLSSTSTNLILRLVWLLILGFFLLILSKESAQLSKMKLKPSFKKKNQLQPMNSIGLSCSISND